MPEVIDFGQALGDAGIAGARAIIAFAELGQGKGRRRIAETGNDDAIGEDFGGDLAALVFVAAMGQGVDAGFAQRLLCCMRKGSVVMSDAMETRSFSSSF